MKLLTVAAFSYLAQLALQLAVRTGSQGNVRLTHPDDAAGS